VYTTWLDMRRFAAYTYGRGGAAVGEAEVPFDKPGYSCGLAHPGPLGRWDVRDSVVACVPPLAVSRKMADGASKPLVENALAGIVLTAQTFNPSMFTETWLTQNGLIPADAFVGVRIFSPEVAQFQTADLHVLVIPPKMQITFGIRGDAGGADIPQRIATRTVELLPHTPYQGLGLNFEFFVAQPEGQDFNSYNRVLLGDGDYRLLREFSVPDAKFGRYFSKKHGDARLKLNITPVRAGPASKDFLHFSFNFHHDVTELAPEDRVQKLKQFIAEWSSLRQYAQCLVDLGMTT